MLAWLAACCHRALESSGDRRLRAHRGTEGQTLPIFTAQRSYASAVFGVVILSVCPSVCPSVRHTRAL